MPGRDELEAGRGRSTHSPRATPTYQVSNFTKFTAQTKDAERYAAAALHDLPSRSPAPDRAFPSSARRSRPANPLAREPTVPQDRAITPNTPLFRARFLTHTTLPLLASSVFHARLHGV